MRGIFAVQSNGYSLRGEESEEEERAASRVSSVSLNIRKGPFTT